MPTLSTPATVRHRTIKNRIVMPPMVCFGYTGHDGLVTERNVQHYTERAQGGPGLIIVEATCVSRDGRLSDVQLGLWSDDHIEGFRKIAEVCHFNGAAVLVQIHHGGLATAPSVSNDLMAPSDFEGISSRSGAPLKARGMSLAEIQAVQADFVAAAIRAQKAGLDGVELHGAHGFLLSQFFSPLVNKRQDQYGGNLPNRARFATEIVQQIRQATRDEFIIGCRIGGIEPGLAEGIGIARELERAGADILHVSTGMSNIVQGAAEPVVPNDFAYNWIVYAGTQIKHDVSVPVIVVNGIRTPEQAAYLVENNLADFVALGKALLANPNWPAQALEKAAKPRSHLTQARSVATCSDCKVCAYFRPGAQCPVQRRNSGI